MKIITKHSLSDSGEIFDLFYNYFKGFNPAQSLIRSLCKSNRLFSIKNKSGKVIAAMMVSGFGEEDIDIEYLAVSKRYQRHGYGSALISYLKDKKQYSISVGSYNYLGAISFYKKLGFKKCGSGTDMAYCGDCYKYLKWTDLKLVPENT